MTRQNGLNDDDSGWESEITGGDQNSMNQEPVLVSDLSTDIIQLPEDIQEFVDKLSYKSGFTPDEVLQYALKVLQSVLRLRRDGFCLYKSRGKSVVEWKPPWPESYRPRINRKKETGKDGKQTNDN